MKRGTPRHPKLQDLRDILKCSLPTAVGYLELLWHFTAEFAPQGDIGRYSDKRIEASMGWRGRNGDLIKALIKAGWIDQVEHVRIIVHDWHQHCEASVKRRLERNSLEFLTDTSKVTGQSPVSTEPHNPLKKGRNHPVTHPVPPIVPRQYSQKRVNEQRVDSDSYTETDQTLLDKNCLPSPSPSPYVHQVSIDTPVKLSSNGKDRTARAPASPSRFSEWIKPWPRVTNAKTAAREWQKHVSAASEAAAFAARDRYLESDEVARNVIMSPEKFIRQQAEAGWTGKWPPPARPAGKEKTFVSDVTKVIQKRLAKGERPW